MSSLRSAGFWGAGLSPAAAEFSAALTCAGCIVAFAPFPAAAEGQLSEEEGHLRPRRKCSGDPKELESRRGSGMEVAVDRQTSSKGQEVRAATEHTAKGQEKGAGRKEKHL